MTTLRSDSVLSSDPLSIPFSELARHNTSASLWIAIRGQVYDVTQFQSKHPGGQDLLLYAAGRDATQVFETYHVRPVHQVLAKYKIGTLVGRGELPTFPPRAKFIETLKSRVYSHLSANNIDPKLAPWMWVRYISIYCTVFMSWYAQLFLFPTSTFPQAICALVLGFFCAQIGLNPLHDASHFAATHCPWVWNVLGASHDFLNGASYIVWIYQHMLGHHSYTNIEGADPDITTSDPDIRRIKPTQPWYKHYINQHLFVPILYGVLSIKTRIQDIAIVYYIKKNDQIRINTLTTWHTAVFWFGKAFFVFYRIVIPIFVANLSVQRTLALFILADLVSSYWLALTFQANHVVEETAWPIPNADNQMDQDWAELQLRTTQDYAHNSMFWTCATGALNYQSVHHLFPEISQYYYPLITPIVKHTCNEFNVKFLYKETFLDAIQSHFSFLKVLGLGDDLKSK